ncbi:MAG: hypothetical protein J6Y78_12060 [Paludibacteraceae bacterium]|nr:hypothetical protein [Paludibacteraceae bacterium]
MQKRIIYTLLFICGISTMMAQETTVAPTRFEDFAKKLDVAYYCLPNKAPYDFRSAFLESWEPNECYQLKSKKLFKNSYDQKSYLQYFLSFYHFNDTTKCRAAVDRFFSKERIEGLKYMVDGSAKTSPMVMIFNSKSIYCLYGFCKTELAPWETLKEAFIAEYAENNAILLIAKCGGVRWETYKRDE